MYYVQNAEKMFCVIYGKFSELPLIRYMAGSERKS